MIFMFNNLLYYLCRCKNMSPHRLLVGNPENIDISKKKIEYTFQYDFLGDSIPDTITTLYYKQLCQVSAFKLKNIYQFLFLRSVQLHKLYVIFPQMKNNKNKSLTPEEINELLKDYISNNTLQKIMIMNGIYLYFHPSKQQQQVVFKN